MQVITQSSNHSKLQKKAKFIQAWQAMTHTDEYPWN